ncbi:sulfide quinone oxidoreductase [Leptinotarsa decemlineata]|uniref:sulfide quinone oxidoreductase n=1 Tax=Leptinotarsa decemlineata TaxID=7539 RepID=UPI003D306DFD
MIYKLAFKNFKLAFPILHTAKLSTTPLNRDKHNCKLLIVGGGTGGCAVAAKFAKSLNKKNLVILEPSEHHYYQPLFTLIGGGVGSVETARRNEKDVLPKNSVWIQDQAAEFIPKANVVHTTGGHTIEYDYLLIAVGLDLRYDKIPGLLDALSRPGGVCSNYSPKYVDRTFEALSVLDGGNAIFTFPNSPVKCPGAPQKICYLVDHYLRLNKKREKVNIMYNTSLPVIFGVKKYADALWKVCKERDINVNLRTNLISIDSDKQQAMFENLDKPDIKTIVEYSMLHVTPPMSTPECLNQNKDLTNEAGFVDVDKSTLQHLRYPNIFAIGDCSSSPNSKTAAAAAAQSAVVYENLSAVMKGQEPQNTYDGYASCPLITGYDKCILAEFDYNLNPLETFPFSQDRELYSMYFLKKNLMPPLYWHLMLNGYWNGPAPFRKLMHLELNGKKEKLIT